jgi:hypothetical protein
MADAGLLGRAHCVARIFNNCWDVKLMNIGSYENKPSRFRVAIYYCQRMAVNAFFRALVVRVLGAWIGKRSDTSVDVAASLLPLKEDGIVQLGQLLTETQCAEIVAYLSDKPVHDKTTSVDRAFSELQPDDMGFGIHFPTNVLDCPHIMEIVSSPKIVQLAADYLGCNPTLSCLGVQWSFPTTTPGVAQTFHRDSEDWKYLRFLIYLTDVDDGCGPHVYVKGSHRDNLPLRLKVYPPEEISQQYGSENFIKILGKRGTAIAADTSGIHKGELPTVKPRLVLNFLYAILPNVLCKYEPLETRHSPGLANYTNRLYLR